MYDIFILSVIQGVTEFLPVSSSGHLILLPSLMGMQDHNMTVDGILHFGTLCAVIVYFWRDIMLMVGAFFKTLFQGKEARVSDAKQLASSTAFYFRLSMMLILATIPVVVAGFVAKRFGVDALRTPFVIGVMSIVGGMILLLSDLMGRHNRSLLDLKYSHAFLIGCAQIFSLIPGGSRSGMCLIGARLLCYDRVSAVTFTFLMAIPSVGGAFTLIMYDAMKEGLLLPWQDMALYFLLSFSFGLMTIHFMLRFVSRLSLVPFGLYRIALGLGILMWG